MDLVSLAVAMTVMARIEHRTVSEYGLPGRGAFGKRFWEGVVWGLAMVTAMVLLQRAEHVFEFGTVALHSSQVLQIGLLWGTATLLVGIFEELTFRGYVQFTLASGIGFWPAAVVSSLLFGASHMSDSFYNWQGLFSAALFGLLFCLILRRTVSLWMAVGFSCCRGFLRNFPVLAAEPRGQYRRPPAKLQIARARLAYRWRGGTGSQPEWADCLCGRVCVVLSFPSSHHAG